MKAKTKSDIYGLLAFIFLVVWFVSTITILGRISSSRVEEMGRVHSDAVNNQELKEN